MIKILTPPPTPFPTYGRLPVAFPLQGRGAATALLATWDSVGSPLPCRGGAATALLAAWDSVGTPLPCRRGAATALLGKWDSVGTPLPCRGGVGGGVSE